MNVIISQALATGLPVITTNHSGLPDQVKDGYNGFLVEEGNYQMLAERIIYLIENPQIWPEFGKNGRYHVEKYYNFELLIQKQINIYNRLLNESDR
jgi:colanic acid/amylovoran biosynthesis glycosyltransferase